MPYDSQMRKEDAAFRFLVRKKKVKSEKGGGRVLSSVRVSFLQKGEEGEPGELSFIKRRLAFCEEKGKHLLEGKPRREELKHRDIRKGEGKGVFSA